MRKHYVAQKQIRGLIDERADKHSEINYMRHNMKLMFEQLGEAKHENIRLSNAYVSMLSTLQSANWRYIRK